MTKVRLAVTLDVAQLEARERSGAALAAPLNVRFLACNK